MKDALSFCPNCNNFALEDTEDDLIFMDGKLAYMKWQCTSCGVVYLFNRNDEIEFKSVHIPENKK